MKRALLFFVAIACCASAFGDNLKAVRKTLDSNYKAFTKDFQKRDSKAMLAMMTDDYTVTQPGGQTLTKQQIGDAMETQMKMTSNATWIRKITSLKLDGKKAIAQVQGNFHGTITGPDSKPHDFKLDAVTTDTWVKTSSGYKLQKSVVLKNNVAVDGKPMHQPGG